MNTFTLGACFQHKLHMGPYFMTFAPRLVGKRRGDGLKHTKLLHWMNERSECQVSNRWLPRWHLQSCFKRYQWDRHYLWDINGIVSRFFLLRRDTRVTTRMTKIVSSKYKDYEENMGNFTKLLLLIIQHTMNELNSVS